VHAGESEVDFTEALYQLVRHCGYTWEQVLAEDLPRTLYSLEMLNKEAEQKQEKQKQVKKQAP